MHSNSLVPLALLASLQVADAYLTWRVLDNGGREMNPLVRILMDRLGVVAGLVVAKLALLILAAFWLADHLVLMLVLIGLYAWVVMHNWKELASHSQSHQSSKEADGAK